jgi:disulfide oxidoreductase YuzD
VENLIKIFCPKKKCGKCTRLVARVEEAVKISEQPWRIEKTDSLDEMMKYPTWVFPTLVINGKVTARGYVPSVKMIVKKLTDNESIL